MINIVTPETLSNPPIVEGCGYPSGLFTALHKHALKCTFSPGKVGPGKVVSRIPNLCFVLTSLTSILDFRLSSENILRNWSRTSSADSKISELLMLYSITIFSSSNEHPVMEM